MDFLPCSGVSIIEFEQVNFCWVNSSYFTPFNVTSYCLHTVLVLRTELRTSAEVKALIFQEKLCRPAPAIASVNVGLLINSSGNTFVVKSDSK